MQDDDTTSIITLLIPIILIFSVVFYFLHSQRAKRATITAAREAAAKTMNGVVVHDKSGYWAIMPKKDWMGMRKRNYRCWLS
jgi:preprotein translocase subunit YajC